MDWHRLWRALASATSPADQARTVKRRYAAAAPSRSMSVASSRTSADSELRTSLTHMRARTRALSRDSSYAKRAKRIVVNNVVGSGIGLQGQIKSTRGQLRKPLNSAIEEAFREWSDADACHTGGTLHFHDFERALIGEVFDAGEVFVRLHFRPFGGSEIPFALELVESERVPETVAPDAGVFSPRTRMGIEVDQYHRPVNYWLRDHHPGEPSFGPRDPMSERVSLVPASEILHLRIVDRWPQTRGVPWLHTAVIKLHDMAGYSEAEIFAARAAANYLAAIERGDWQDPQFDQVEGDAIPGSDETETDLEVELEPGVILRLLPGEKMNFYSPNRPNAALDPFMRYMLREVAAGCDVSYESLSRDYSQSNYSSSRLALIDDRDNWRMLQAWFIRSFRRRIHRLWLQQAVLAGAIPGLAWTEYALDARKFEAVKFKPRGWTWIDPTKEVQAAKEAVKAGFDTRSHVISSTAEGRDIEDVDEERRQELDAQQELDLSYDTDPGAGTSSPPPGGGSAPPRDDSEGDEVDEEGASDQNQRRGNVRAIG